MYEVTFKISRNGPTEVVDGLHPNYLDGGPFPVGFISQDGDHWRGTSTAKQQYNYHEWKRNEGQDFPSREEALEWIKQRAQEEFTRRSN